MRKLNLNKIAIISCTFIATFAIASAAHVYSIKQGKKANESTVSMARLNFSNPITNADVAIITYWLKQNGAKAVMVNTTYNNAVFTYAPLKTNVNSLVDLFNKTTNYKATKYSPSEAQMKSGCPAI
jgi:K+-sensing histidine kinase KdpD